MKKKKYISSRFFSSTLLPLANIGRPQQTLVPFPLEKNLKPLSTGSQTVCITFSGDLTQLHLQNGIMLGFGGRAVYRKKAPPGVWTLSLETGFVGCVRDLVLDGVTINLVSLSLEQDHGSV